MVRPQGWEIPGLKEGEKGETWWVAGIAPGDAQVRVTRFESKATVQLADPFFEAHGEGGSPAEQLIHVQELRSYDIRGNTYAYAVDVSRGAYDPVAG